WPRWRESLRRSLAGAETGPLRPPPHRLARSRQLRCGRSRLVATADHRSPPGGHERNRRGAKGSSPGPVQSKFGLAEGQPRKKGSSVAGRDGKTLDAEETWWGRILAGQRTSRDTNGLRVPETRAP